MTSHSSRIVERHAVVHIITAFARSYDFSVSLLVIFGLLAAVDLRSHSSTSCIDTLFLLPPPRYNKSPKKVSPICAV